MSAVGTRDMLIDVDDVEYSPEVTNARFTSNPGEGNDTETYKQAREGGSERAYAVVFNAQQDLAQETLWRLIYEHVGEKVLVTLRPYGNEIPSQAQPHTEQMCTIAEPDGDWIGGAASSATTAKQYFEVTWKADGRPILVTAPKV